MEQLRQFQRQMRDSLLSGRDDAVLAHLGGTAETKAARLAIHRNTVRESLHETLTAAFPVTRRIVGPATFAPLAHGFITAHPPRAPRLCEYGGDFPGFITGHDIHRRLPYLADVARLEWARQETYFARDAAALDATRLTALTPEAMAAQRLPLHPAARLVTATFPIQRIWEVNQREEVPVVDMREGQCVIITRPALTVYARAIPPTDAALISALSNGLSFGDAAAKALSADPTFDLTAALALHFAGGTFVSSRAA